MANAVKLANRAHRPKVGVTKVRALRDAATGLDVKKLVPTVIANHAQKAKRSAMEITSVVPHTKAPAPKGLAMAGASTAGTATPGVNARKIRHADIPLRHSTADIAMVRECETGSIVSRKVRGLTSTVEASARPGSPVHSGATVVPRVRWRWDRAWTPGKVQAAQWDASISDRASFTTTSARAVRRTARGSSDHPDRVPSAKGSDRCSGTTSTVLRADRRARDRAKCDVPTDLAMNVEITVHKGLARTARAAHRNRVTCSSSFDPEKLHESRIHSEPSATRRRAFCFAREFRDWSPCDAAAP